MQKQMHWKNAPERIELIQLPCFYFHQKCLEIRKITSLAYPQ
jgi:hypothetical protein